ncbi:RHS repeat-associated core domain-containing protein [Aeromicrobium sp. CF3.5]|uniref:RHS repeat-associated core domain-containing protein n=1 Tax=Aeromicrobium sp. CF3.5 TaxID=3373078 RepID=UPI003EE56104
MRIVKRGLIYAASVSVAASLLMPINSPAAAAVEKAPVPAKEKPVPVQAVGVKGSPKQSKASAVPTVELPSPSRAKEAQLPAAAWSEPVAGLSVKLPRSADPTAATVQRVGVTNDDGAAGLGPVFEIEATEVIEPEPETPTTPQPSPSPAPDATATPEPGAEPTSDVPPGEGSDVNGQATPVEPASVGVPAADPTVEPTLKGAQIQVEYADFAEAVGGDWSDRLRLVLLEDCDTVKGTVDCTKATPLKTKNDTKQQTLTAQAPASASTQSMTVAATSSSSGSSGDYTASSLAPSSTWSAGGQTGDFTWSYPLATPPGINGPEPDLAIDYSSGSVDGRTSSTNNQTSWIGEGFDLDPGFIERSYEPCEQVSGTPENVGDLCWRDDNVNITLNGKGSTLVQDGSSNKWKMKSDDGTRIELLTESGVNADGDGEYWRVTTLDGTKYYYGRNKRWAGDDRRTDSVSAMPVYGARAGDPCHESTYAASSCSQAWRWSLDYVVDPNGNSMSLFWDQEKNSYGSNKNETVRGYDRAPLLKSIEYGTRHGNDAPAPAKVVFTSAERCVTTSTFDCTGLEKSNASKWPDVPFDQICSSGTSCADRTAPTFFSRKRLTQITSQVLGSGGDYTSVNEWNLGQSLANTHEDSVDPDNPGDSRTLTLESIQQTGKVGEDIALPAVTFSKALMDNRIENYNGLPTFQRYRVTSIANGTGGVISANYSARDCTASSVPSASALDLNSRRCFPVWYQPWWSEDRQLEFFHKYRVDSVVESDLTGGAPEVTTAYGYGGGDGWHYTTSTIDESANRSWNEWRGYARVSTTIGGQSAKTFEHSLYMRGMHGDRTASGGTKSVTVTDSYGDSTNIVDYDDLAGFPRRTRTQLGSGGALVEATVNNPWRSAVTASSGGREARIVQTATTQATTPLAAGGQRVTRVGTTFNSLGLPTSVHDEGDIALSTDNRCTTTTYATNPSAGMYAYPAQEVTTGLACGSAPTQTAQVISASRTGYDGGTLGVVPTRGNPTRVDTASGLSGSTINYQRDATTTYDAYGRATSVADAKNQTTSTAYAPATGPVDTVTTTNPLEQSTVTSLNRAWGEANRVTDIAGANTDTTYDALGRTTAIWGPGRIKGTDTAHATFAYRVSATQANAVTTKTLNPAGDYVTSVAFFDGLMRDRSTQSPSANVDGGRLVSETTYDDRGWVSSKMGPYYSSGAVDTTLVSAAENQVDSYTLLGYDQTGRVTRESLASLGAVKWSTTYRHDGNGTRTTPPSGGTATFAVEDARGQTVKLHQFLGAAASGTNDETNYTYTPAGQIATVTDSSGTSWRKTYDIRGRLITDTDPDKGESTFTYDELDRQVTSTDARGVTLWTGYDKLGRKTELRDDTATGTQRAGWLYDTVRPGALTSSTRYADGQEYTSETLTADDAGRPLTSRVLIPESEGLLHRAGGHLFGNTYNPDGSVKTANQPLVYGITNENLRYTYDALGNVTRLAGSGHMVWDTIRTAKGQVLQRTLGSTSGKLAYATNSFDPATDRLTRQTYSLQGTATTNRMDMRYTFDPSGQVTRRDDVAAADTRRECFTYDYLRRLKQARTTTSTTCAALTDATLGTQAAYADTYTYAKNGNRTQVETKRKTGSTVSNRTDVSTFPTATTARPHAVARTVRTGAGAGTESFVYDQIGNMTKRSKSTTSGKTYEWDREGHVKKITDLATGKTIEYLYDADGNRLIERDGTDSSTTMWLGTAEITVKAGVRSTVRTYTVDGVPVAIRDKNGIQSVGADHQSTPVITSSATTQAWTKRRYSPFGEQLQNPTTAWPSDRGYLNKSNDTSAGTVHLDAREYDPAAGRFISVDPIGDLSNPQQLNGYAYANNTPVTLADPSGLYVDGGVRTNRTAPVIKKRGGRSYAQAGDNYVRKGGSIQGSYRRSKPYAMSQAKSDFRAGVVHGAGATVDLLGQGITNRAAPGHTFNYGGRAANWVNRSLGANPNSLAGILGQIAFAFIPIGGGASGFGGTSRALTASLALKAERAAANGADNAANGVRLGQQLARESADSAFAPSGQLSSGAVQESQQIIRGSDFGNKQLVRRLTSDGSNIADWGKFQTRSHQSPSGSFKAHFYMNRSTGAIDYGYDYKIVFDGVSR